MFTKYPDFRRIWSGRLVSNAGDSIYNIVITWFVLQYTNSSWWVGVLNFFILIPEMLSFVIGPIIDNNNKKLLLIICELGQMLAIMVIIVMMTIGNVNMLLLCLMVFIASFFGMNTYPIQDAFIPSFVANRDLPKAESFLSVAYRGTDYLFNGVTGFLLKAFSYLPLLITDILTFVFSIVMFSRIDFNDKQTKRFAFSLDKQFFRDIGLGFKLILHNSVILFITVVAALINFLFGGLNIYEVLLGRSMGGSQFYGIITAVSAIGLLIGSTLMSNVVLKKIPLGKRFILAHLIGGLLMSALVLCAKNNVALLIVWLLTFLFLGVTQVLQVPMIQLVTDKQHMGKVMSTFYSITLLFMPIGSLFFGYIGSKLNIFSFLLILGVAYIAAGLFLTLNKRLFRMVLAK
ncbi:MFS transporter [Lactiplantibacillus nangangensis]|uniref:MFS transporter n=1 Tax=Lactiplantibacillus nangangensis TaxID=2559917 RepID=A0ABW1SIG3_9LACO|nr:MFS transporter [Lactiplantibacillus nangangensis]